MFLGTLNISKKKSLITECLMIYMFVTEFHEQKQGHDKENS